MDDEIVRFAPEAEFRDEIHMRLQQVTELIRPVVGDAEIHHVGSTAIPGSLTKGDLDIQVRISKEGFAAAREGLTRLFSVNEGGFLEVDAVSFEDYSRPPFVGVHLTVAGGSCDVQARFRDLLRDSDALRAEYDDLKRRFHGGSMDAYRIEKADFVSRVLGWEWPDE